MKRKAIIFGIKGTKLTNDEKNILEDYKPWGIILFSRNIQNLIQAKLLIKNIKKIIRDKNYPILIDQEGGKVSRLNNITDMNLFSQAYFGNLYKKNIKLFNNQYKIHTNKLCDVLKNIGVNINTIPVLDIRRKGASNIIGNRSFSEDS